MLAKKWWIIIGIAVVVVALAIALPLTLISKGVDLSSPKATVNSYLDAFEHQNAGRMADCCHFPITYQHLPFDDRASFVSLLNLWFGFIDSIDISNLNVNVTAQNETSATVEASYHLREVLADGTIDESDLTRTFEVQKTGDNWYIVSTWAV